MYLLYIKMFKCQYCGKSLSSQCNLDHHIEIRVCRRPDRTCPMCEQVFESKRSCQHHMSLHVCQKQRNPKTKTKLTLKQTQLVTPEYADLSREELISQLEKTKTQYQTLRDNPQNVNVQHNNQIVVFPSEFGQETIQNIQEKLGDILTPLIKKGGSYIPILTDRIHGSKKLPEPCLSQRLHTK